MRSVYHPMKFLVYRLTACVGLLIVAAPATAQGPTDVIVAKDGKAHLSILTGTISVPASELRQRLEEMTGAKFATEPAKAGKIGIYVGLLADFPWLRNESLKSLGKEGFAIKSDGESLYLIGETPAG